MFACGARTPSPPGPSPTGGSASPSRRSATARSPGTSTAGCAGAPSCNWIAPPATSCCRTRCRSGSSSSPPAAASPRSSGCCAITWTTYATWCMVHSSPVAGRLHLRRARCALWPARGGSGSIEQNTDADGMLSPSDLDRLVPDWPDRQTWACGPIGMLDDLQDHWTAKGLDDRLHTERFRPAFVAVGDGGQVEFSKSGLSAQASGAMPLLDVGEAAGVLMPSGCRMGICYGCVSTPDRRHRPRPAHRRPHHRRSRRHHRHPDLHQRRRQRLPARPLKGQP